MLVVVNIANWLYDAMMGHREPIYSQALGDAVRDGIPLPKGHGRLIILSEDRLKENQINLDWSCQKWISEVGLSNATVKIIKADTEIIEADAPKRRKGTPLEENDNGYNCENWIP